MECKKVVITGCRGLLGYHLHVACEAMNSAARYCGEKGPFEIVCVDRTTFNSIEKLSVALINADVVFHFAGVNRSDNVRDANKKITDTLISALDRSGSIPHIFYANSIQSEMDNEYGLSKKETAEAFSNWANNKNGKFSDYILPHIFGEYSKPNYNTVTATLCDSIVCGKSVEINPAGAVELLHAGDVANEMLDCYREKREGRVRLTGKKLSVLELYDQLIEFDSLYKHHTMPDLTDRFILQLFNTYRSFVDPESLKLKQNTDERGVLFEVVKGGGGGQSFMSWTKPGVTRGEHFHRYKVERFLVLKGQAEIKIRRMFHDEVYTFEVDGTTPMIVDMPTLCTHNITNTGSDDLLTMFWSHEVFDSNNPDTFQSYV